MPSLTAARGTPVACTNCGDSTRLESVCTVLVHSPATLTENGTSRPDIEHTGGESRMFDECAEATGRIWCRACDTEFLVLPVPPTYTDLDGQPFDITRVTVSQIVSSAYGWANGDIDDLSQIDSGMEDGADHQDGPDSFGSFLIAETSADGDDLHSFDHWQTARSRMAQVLREVQSVCDALDKFGPEASDLLAEVTA